MDGSILPPPCDKPKNLAGLGRRFIARIIDNIIGSLLLIPAVFMGMLPMYDALTVYLGWSVKASSFGIFFLVLAFAYWLGADALKGQSLGKRMMKIRVVDEYTGASCTLLQSIVRNLALVFGILDYIFIFFGSRKRLGDMIVGTKVLRADGPQVG